MVEKKSHIEEETRHRLRDLEEERQQLTKEVESIASKLARIYERSEALGQQILRVENIRKVATDTDNLQTVANLELYLHRLPKPGSLLQKSTLRDKCINYITEDERTETNDNDGRLQEWPLIVDVAGGGRYWPVIPWQHFTALVRVRQKEYRFKRSWCSAFLRPQTAKSLRPSQLLIWLCCSYILESCVVSL